MGVINLASNLYLYLGAFLVATGIGVPIGAVFLLYWAVQNLSSKPCGSQVNYGSAEFTQNNYYVGGSSNNGGSAPSDSQGARYQELPHNFKRDYISNETLEEHK